MSATIIIPAHDEEAVITRCLDTLSAGAAPGEWQVVVAANGCTDRTVELARRHPSAPLVLDLAAPGKPAALNAADAVATGFPRIYLDADIQVPADTIRALVATLAEPGVRVAAPAAAFRTEGCSALVRSYYRIWRGLPFLHEAHVGSGIFAVDREGHERVAPFPAIVAEDEYVRRSFRASERRTSPGTFDVRVARTIGALVRRGTRTRAGNRELAALAALPAPVAPASSRAYVLARARSPRELPHVVVFLAVTVAVRVLSELKLRRGDTRWERDDSSRTHPDGSTPAAARPASPAPAPAPARTAVPDPDGMESP
ncbi:glycosyltransferase family 2 protein [Pengzhenrongella sicca]|uniref:4,4'-diaponeurosporenoate glycosyltransferase n=1 Tax=Pengzhenrongella sicca TaxID=2819238 RepID=A0A8A4ZGK0_9MICO|nr:glycosyltransferase [Pengzhenrongella sicca]QTE29656.1 glycosyltransferase [Pengzhenrongella sicca]